MDFVGLAVWFVWAVFLAGSALATARYAERCLQYLKNLQELGLEHPSRSRSLLSFETNNFIARRYRAAARNAKLWRPLPAKDVARSSCTPLLCF